MVLHTLNAPPASAAFLDFLRVVSPDDAVLLLGDGVYAAVAGTQARRQLESCGAELHVLRADAAAAGIMALVGAIDVVDFAGFVALTERYPRQMGWY